MAKNKFDKENVGVVSSDEVPHSIFWGSEKVYDIKEQRQHWWQCPKCGGDISFDSIVEEFDEEIGEKQFITVYSWWCEDCGAQGSVHALVNPLYISMEPDEDEG